jgi:hypothetical protein
MPIKPAAPTKPRLRAADGSFSARGTISAKLLRKVWSAPASPAVAAPRMFAAAPQAPVEFFSNFTADKVDTTNAIIRGVSVMTSGLIARGHDLEVDSTTLDQVKTCAESKTEVPVKVDHKSGAAAVCGFLTNFHLDGTKLKADWHLLKTHALKDTILEVAERMPGGVGLSASFLPPAKGEKTASGKKAARCAELLSVDYVTLPAANPDGMFSAKVDSSQPANPAMTITPEIQAAIDAAVQAATAHLTEQITALQGQLDEAQQGADDQELDLQTLAEMSDEELSELGLDPAAVDQAIAEHNEAAEAEAGEGEEGELATAGAGEGEGEATGLQANVVAQLTQFAAELRQAKAERDAAEQNAAIEQIETNFDALIDQVTHLQEQLATGGQAATHAVGVHFSTKTGAAINFGTKEPGAFEEAVIVEFDAQLAANPKISKAVAQSIAFRTVIKNQPDDYADYQARRGIRK